MLDNAFYKEIFPNIQSKPSLAQFEAISSYSTIYYPGEEIDLHLAKTSFQVVAGSEKVLHDASG